MGIGLFLWLSLFPLPDKGLDLLGLARFDAVEIARLIEPDTAIGTLMGTFGDPLPKLDKILASGKVPSIRVHLSNGTCLRNHNCEASEISPLDFKALAKRARAVQALRHKYPNLACYISPHLESDVKDKAVVRKWLKIIKENAPGCIPVISSFTGFAPDEALREKHGVDAHANIISFDGDDGFQSDVLKYSKQGRVIVFFWTNRLNLRLNSEATFTPPSKRPVYPIFDHIIHALRLFKPAEPKGPAPAICKRVLEVKPPEIGKPRSEDYGRAGDGRSDRPLLLSTFNADKFEIYSPQGKKIACAEKYPGQYQGLNRYYVGSCSGHTAVSLMNEARSEWSFWRSQDTCIRFNNIRRSGVMR